jgi:hypothetical protein
MAPRVPPLQKTAKALTLDWGKGQRADYTSLAS